MHAPEVECIAKGKAHKRYEFGCKASIATTSKGNWIVGAQALSGNPYDGHTLAGAMEQIGVSFDRRGFRLVAGVSFDRLARLPEPSNQAFLPWSGDGKSYTWTLEINE